MKHKLVCAVVAIMLLVPAISLAGPLVFSMSPGQTVQSAQVGMSFGNLMPYFGFDLMGVAGKATINTTDKYYDAVTNAYLGTIESKLDGSASAALFIPHFGARFYFATEPLKPYLYAGFLKSMPFVSAELSVSESVRDANGVVLASTSDKMKLKGDAKEAITKPLGFWGMSLGFGSEYPFSENFTLGGEFGLQWFHTSTSSNTTTTTELLEETLVSELSSEMSASLKLTTARIVLNYQF